MSTTAAYPVAANVQSAAPSSALSISSLVLGLVSMFAGWTLLAPVAGLVLGVMALSREPHSRNMAIWGIVLNAVMLAGSMLLVVLALAFGLALLPFLPLAVL
ncbi:MAG: hypothetical protein JWQ59_1891 [Cryobacterium sp.]|jgi:hypothetical protein|nr:hypothetical protein [Cryobacterium sp.]